MSEKPLSEMTLKELGSALSSCFDAVWTDDDRALAIEAELARRDTERAALVAENARLAAEVERLRFAFSAEYDAETWGTDMDAFIAWINGDWRAASGAAPAGDAPTDERTIK